MNSQAVEHFFRTDQPSLQRLTEFTTIMATKQPAYTWENGFRQTATNAAPWEQSTTTAVNGGGKDAANAVRNQQDDIHAYVAPPTVELVTSPVHNHLGINVIRHWPTLYDGSNNPHGVPTWWMPKEKVDVLICGGEIWLPWQRWARMYTNLTLILAGPSGLAIAVSLARQGLSFRIIGIVRTGIFPRKSTLF